MQSKSMDWFMYDKEHRLERLKYSFDFGRIQFWTNYDLTKN